MTKEEAIERVSEGWILQWLRTSCLAALAEGAAMAPSAEFVTESDHTRAIREAKREAWEEGYKQAEADSGSENWPATTNPYAAAENPWEGE